MSRASYWHPDHSRRVAKARERYAQRAGGADAVGQDLDHAASRRPRNKPTKAGVLADGKDVTGIDVRQKSVAIFISRETRGKLRYCAASAASLSVG